MDSPLSLLPGSLPDDWRPESGSRFGSSKQRWPSVIAVIAIEIKACRSGRALSRPGPEFALSLLPSIAVAGPLTFAFVRLAHCLLLPSVWLPFHGVAAISGTVTLFTPACGNLAMALACGDPHILFGIWIASKHGG